MAASRRRSIAFALGLTTTAALSLFLFRARAWGQNEGTVLFHSYQDSRGVTVLSPSVTLDRDFTDRMSVKARFGLDAVSAASDSCARCHPSGENMQRGFLSAAVTRKLGTDTKLSVGGEASLETFYRSFTGSASITRNLNQGNTTVAAGYSFSRNSPTLHPTESVASQNSQTAFIAVTQSVTKSTTVQLGYEYGRLSGYLDSPFLRASLNGVRTLGLVPDLRTRNAITARARQAFGTKTFLDANYRRYTDSWEVVSNTFEAGLTRHATDSVVVGGSFRRYAQTAAFFWAPSYTGNPQYFTADFRLMPFNSNLYSGHAEYKPASRLGFLPEASAVTLDAEFYRADNGFQANMFTVGFRFPMKK